MRVLHVCISGPFTDGLSYQENQLVEQHVALGQDVTVIAATDTYGPDKQIVHANVGITRLNCGATLIRLPYAWGMRGWLATKIRAHHGLLQCVTNIKPDRILFHGLTAWDLLTVATYVRRNPKTQLFVDCHEDFNNSAKTWLSRELLHRLFYKPIFRNCISQFKEVLCVTVESLVFAVDFYGSPRSKTRIYPLGCTVETAETVAQQRADFRARFGLVDTDLVITQTGKLDHTKHLASALRAFCANPSSALKFIIAGRMSDDVRAMCLPFIKSDPRIFDLGWQSTDELRLVLAGTDCFLQPFGQTVTTQMAMGCGCVILAQDLPSHRWLVGDKGYLFNEVCDLDAVFKWVIENQENLDQLRQATLEFAAEYLDYKKLALRIIS